MIINLPVNSVVLKSECVNAQSDLELHCSHLPEYPVIRLSRHMYNSIHLVQLQRVGKLLLRQMTNVASVALVPIMYQVYILRSSPKHYIMSAYA